MGIVDADYYNNKSNEGHIFTKLQNESEETLELKAGTALVQGIFVKYLTTKSDNRLDIERESSY